MSTYLSSLVNGLDVGYYVYDYDRETASYTSTACDSYTLYFRPMTGAEIQGGAVLGEGGAGRGRL